MSQKIQRQQGFTLLEVMIALTIFAVISTLAWQILDGAMRTSSATEASAEKLNQLQRTYNLLNRDFFQLQARAPRNEGNVFVQDGNDVELTTLNGISGQLLLERVSWRLEKNQLWRDVWPAIDSPATVQPETVSVLSGVKEMKWRFYRQGWLANWTDPAHQPEGAELTLTMEKGETWRWVFMTPGDVPDAQSAAEQPAPADGVPVEPQGQAKAVNAAPAQPPAAAGGQP